MLLELFCQEQNSGTFGRLIFGCGFVLSIMHCFGSLFEFFRKLHFNTFNYFRQLCCCFIGELQFSFGTCMLLGEFDVLFVFDIFHELFVWWVLLCLVT